MVYRRRIGLLAAGSTDVSIPSKHFVTNKRFGSSNYPPSRCPAYWLSSWQVVHVTGACCTLWQSTHAFIFIGSTG